ncbi:MAG: glycosyltransferase family 2 protein [Edaphobacter sp.]|uniref:glycosyltransferase family 2 protein n=1 Tax=Edaphobacter sp. TaxID=1934404 RepID=UPI0023990DB6|nr:glycosyltransferase family 2 protein [Edaphobacter sp.]MDE1178832.1 glycosyltransferase family 2 protein [Edaphobacter sp.]
MTSSADAGAYSSKAVAERSISICMATYNGARFLRDQLDSLARQTRLPMEIVITDDQSSDETAEVVAAFARTAPFAVRFHRNETRLGYGDNFIKAVELCRGDLISFCDQDDVWMENKLEICAETFRDPGVKLCVHSGELWEGGEERSGRRIPDYPRREAFEPCALHPLQGSYGYAMVFRRELLQVANNHDRFCSLPGEEPMSHDRWIWFLGTIFGGVVLLPDALALYRQHGNNVMGGIATGLGDSLAGASRPRNDLQRAMIEEHAVEYLDGLAAHPLAEGTAPLAHKAARILERGAKSNRVRARIFDTDAGLPARLGAFLKLTASGGYAVPALRSGRTGQYPRRSPMRGMARDFAFGVFRSGSLLKR